MSYSNPDSVSVHDGFPNPATDSSLQSINLNSLLVRHAASTYFMRIASNEWTEQGIFAGDLAIVDRALEVAFASFATQAAFRLRTSRQLTRQGAIFLTTDKHKPGYKRWEREVTYRVPTADTSQLITTLTHEHKKLHSPHYAYHRGGVRLYDFVPASTLQTDLLGNVSVAGHDRATSRMATIDHLNEKFGKRNLHYVAEDLRSAWKPIYNLRSPRYTTHLDELPIIHSFS